MVSKGRTTRRLAQAKSVGLPVRPFLFTLDQVAGLLSLEEKDLRQNYIYFWGRSDFRYRAGGEYLKAINIAAPDEPPVWRVSEEDLLQWLVKHGYTAYH